MNLIWDLNWPNLWATFADNKLIFNQKTKTMGTQFSAILGWFLGSIIYIIFFFVILYFIYKWVTKFISLKQEQNDLLREIIKKMDKK